MVNTIQGPIDGYELVETAIRDIFDIILSNTADIKVCVDHIENLSDYSFNIKVKALRMVADDNSLFGVKMIKTAKVILEYYSSIVPLEKYPEKWF